MLELLVVLTIIAVASLAMAGAMPRIGPLSPLQGGASQLTGMLNQARMRAISRERTTTFTLDSDTRRYWINDTDKAAALPGEVALEHPAGSRLDIRFFPDGGADGGVIVLSDGARQIMLSVSPLTGYVKRL